MPTTFKILGQAAVPALSGTVTAVYLAPSGTKAQVSLIVFQGFSGSANNVLVYHIRAAGVGAASIPTNVIRDIPLSATHISIEFGVGMIIEPTDTIAIQNLGVVSTTASITLYGIEMT